MPSFKNPVIDADEARESLRGLAHATRSMDDPGEVYAVLGSLSSMLASLAQALHQVGDFHDEPARWRALVADDARDGRAASYQVSWELHRAAEMINQVTECVHRAHQVEPTISYDVHHPATLPPPPARRVGAHGGLSL